MRYRVIAPALRHTQAYQLLSAPAPNARTLLEWLMTGDCSGMIPGLLVAGRRTVMEQLGWDEQPEELQRAVWQEALDSGLVRHDPKTRLVWLPFMVSDVYLPDQPNVIKSWAGPWAEIQDCPLKHEAWAALRHALTNRCHRRRDAKGAESEDKKTAFGPLFDLHCPEPRCGQVQGNKQGNSQPASNPETEGNSQPALQKPPIARTGLRAGLRPGSLQEEDQEEEEKQDPSALLESPPARDPAPTGIDPATAHRPQVIPPAWSAMPPPEPSAPPPAVKSRFDCPGHKELIYAAVDRLVSGGEGRILAPLVRGKVELDANTVQRLFGLFTQFDPSDAVLVEMGRIWASDTFWKTRDPTGKQRLCSIQHLTRDPAMFSELLGLAQRNLSGAPALQTKKPTGGRARGGPRTEVASQGTLKHLEDISHGSDDE